MKSIIFLNGFYFALTEIAEVITDDFRLDELIQAIF
jgi:hypothetical protein